MASIDDDGLTQGNAARVFSERDPTRRPAAVRELFAADALVTGVAFAWKQQLLNTPVT